MVRSIAPLSELTAYENQHLNRNSSGKSLEQLLSKQRIEIVTVSCLLRCGKSIFQVAARLGGGLLRFGVWG